MSRRRVLVVTHAFPPDPNVGSVRMRGLARYLPRHGWEPVFLTATLLPGEPAEPFEPARTVRAHDPGNASTLLKVRLGLDPGRSFQEQLGVPARLREAKRPWSRRFFMHLKGWVIFPDEQIHWGRAALRVGRRLLREERFDALLSSSPPPTAHRVAAQLRRDARIPWVADLRDLWSQGNMQEHGRVRNAVDALYERWTLKGADALVTVSEPLARKLGTLHRRRRTHAIPNGFDPRDYEGLPPEPDARELAVVHTGSLYEGRTDPTPVLRAVRELLDEGVLDPRTFRLRFYGRREAWLDAEIAHLRLEGVVSQHGRVPRAEVLKRQAEAQVLLVIVWHDPKDPGIYSGKLFEYLGARRPILAVGGPENSVVRELLERTGAGDYCPGDRGLKATLARHAREHAAGGRVAYAGRAVEIARHDHDAMARQFAFVLDRAVAARASRSGSPC